MQAASQGKCEEGACGFPCGNQSPDVAGVGEFMGKVLSGLVGNNWGSEAVMKGK